MIGSKLDVIYPVTNETIDSLGYKNVIYWNDTTIVPNMPSMPNASPAGGSHKPPPLSPSHIDFPSAPDATTIVMYAIATAVIVAFIVGGVVLKVRRRQLHV
jgi:hypothetical protein